MHLSCLTTEKIEVTFEASDADDTAATVVGGTGTVTDTGTDKLTFISPDLADITEYLVTSTVSGVARSCLVTLVSYLAAPVAELSAVTVSAAVSKT